MGAWGLAIFSDDTACDVRDDYRELIARGVIGAEATRRLIEEYRPEDDPDDTGFWLGLAAYYPTGRAWRYEAIRPELGDLEPLAERILSLSPFWREKWGDLGSYTEAAWVRGALSGGGPRSR